ncbi:Nn.00g076330.m01.CDS01 [Neocucurbitaria sp. VM-36]
MSYLLEFQAGLLPQNIRSPPYVIFAIRGKHVVAELPPRIPLNMVLHFAPKLKQWVLPPPLISHLPWSTACLALRTPYVGINIFSDDVDAIGLEWIITRMLMASGLAHPKSLFLILPSLLTSTSIIKTWLALDLSTAGIQPLHMHIHTNLMLGSAVTLSEMNAIWEIFPHSSPIVRAMGLNFIRSHICFGYTHHEFSEIRNWYLKSAERCKFFKSLEDQFPDFGNVQDNVLKAAAEKEASMKQTAVNKNKEKTAVRIKRVLERTATRKVSPEERKERHIKDAAALRSRLRRTKSDESIRSVETVIWVPPSQNKEAERASDGEASDGDESTGSSINSTSSKAVQTVGNERGSTAPLSRIPRLPLLRGFLGHQAEENNPVDASEKRSQSKEEQEATSRAVPTGKKYATLRRQSGEEELKAEKRLRKFSKRGLRK